MRDVSAQMSMENVASCDHTGLSSVLKIGKLEEDSSRDENNAVKNIQKKNYLNIMFIIGMNKLNAGEINKLYANMNKLYVSMRSIHTDDKPGDI